MNSDPLTVFGRTVCRLRNERGYTQEVLAELADISLRHLIDIEHGDTEVGYKVLRRLHVALEVSWDELLGEDESFAVSPVLRRMRRAHH